MPNEQSEIVVERDVFDELIATLAAVRATTISEEEWADAREHFRNLCREAIELANRALARASAPSMGEVPADVARLVVAAQLVVYEGRFPVHPDQSNELDAALEAFASRVPWDDEPENVK